MAFYYKRIRELREDSDLTQLDVANYLNVGLTTYRRWETGERTVPTNIVVELTKFYNVSADYILGLTNAANPNRKIKNQVTISGGKNKLTLK